MLYRRGWTRAVEAAGASLRASLLTTRFKAEADSEDVDHHDDGGSGYVVNLDWAVVELMHEARHLQLMNVDVDEAALTLCQQQDRITDTRHACVYLRQLVLVYRPVFLSRDGCHTSLGGVLTTIRR